MDEKLLKRSTAGLNTVLLRSNQEWYYICVNTVCGSLNNFVQGLRSEFQMTGANHYLMTLIQSKTIQFSFFLKVFEKLTGANGLF